MLVVFSLSCVLRVCLDYHVFVSVWCCECVCTGILSVNVRLSAHSLTVSLWCCMSVFIGFLIYGETLAYTAPQAWLHLMSGVCPIGMLAIYNTYSFLLARFTVVSNPHVMICSHCLFLLVFAVFTLNIFSSLYQVVRSSGITHNLTQKVFINCCFFPPQN